MAPPSKSLREMLGEFLREAAVLVFVFGFLDLPTRDRETLSFTAGVVYALAVITLSALLLWWGVKLELGRKGR